MQTEHVIEAVYDILGELSENQEKVLEGFRLNTKSMDCPMACFQLLANTLNLKVKKLVGFKQPVKAEVYLPV
jgi:hypothetical protein